jgi:hypothetical protein
MSCVLICRALSQNCGGTVWSSVACIATVALLGCAPHGAFAQTEADFEKPPVLDATELVPKAILRRRWS